MYLLKLWSQVFCAVNQHSFSDLNNIYMFADLQWSKLWWCNKSQYLDKENRADIQRSEIYGLYQKYHDTDTARILASFRCSGTK